MNDRKPLRICVVGTGSMARYVHIPSILKCEQEFPGLQFVACCDICKENLENTLKMYPWLRGYEQFEWMLEKEKPDAVVCLVSEKMVAPISRNIMERKIPILLEKPPGKSADEVQSLCQAAANNQVINMVAFNRRHIPLFCNLKERIGSSVIQNIEYNFYRVKRYDKNFEDTAIHAIDTVRWLSSSDYEKISIFYQDCVTPDKAQSYQNYYIYAVMKNGIAGTIRILVDTNEVKEEAVIHAEGKTMRAVLPAFLGDTVVDGYLEEVRNGKTVYRLDEKMLVPERRPYLAQGFYQEHTAFYQAVREGRCCADNVTTAVQSVIICEAMKNKKTNIIFREDGTYEW